MVTPTTPGRPPVPTVHTRQRDTKSAARPKMLGIRAILQESLWHTRSIHAGGTDRSSSTDETRSLLSSPASGPKELDYRLIKELWAFTRNRIAVRFAYEWHDNFDHWYRSYGNENWEFSDDGLMVPRVASINDIPMLGW